ATDSAPVADARAPLSASAHANVSPPISDPAPVAAVRSLTPGESLFPPLAPDDIDDEPVPASASPEADEAAEGADDRTVIAPRTSRYVLVLADGRRIPVPGSTAILGRKPVATADLPDALLIAVPDSSKTMSKNHAIVELVGDVWYVTDLASTNGVATYTPDG